MQKNPLRPFEMNPRSITRKLRSPSGIYTHVLRPPKQAEWIEIDGKASTTFVGIRLPDGETGWKLKIDQPAAMLALWDKAVIRVEGYGLEEVKEWKELVPLAHKAGACEWLMQVVAVPDENPDPAGFNWERIERRLRCPDHPEEAGCMPLVHILRRPTQLEQIEIERLRTDTVQVSDPEAVNGVATFFPSRLKKICDLWDALIEEVRGYSINGVQCPDVELAVKYIDAMHKRAAITPWLTPGRAVEPEAAVRQ